MRWHPLRVTFQIWVREKFHDKYITRQFSSENEIFLIHFRNVHPFNNEHNNTMQIILKKKKKCLCTLSKKNCYTLSLLLFLCTRAFVYIMQCLAVYNIMDNCKVSNIAQSLMGPISRKSTYILYSIYTDFPYCNLL